MLRIVLLASASLFVLASCNSRIHETVSGPWSIDTMIYKGYDLLPCLPMNIIDFKNETCELPTTENFCVGLIEYEEKGEWTLEDEKGRPLFLNLATENVIFSGRHQISFFKDSVNQLLFMRFKRDSLYIVCRKGSFDYIHNQNLVKDLVERTQ